MNIFIGIYDFLYNHEYLLHSYPDHTTGYSTQTDILCLDGLIVIVQKMSETSLFLFEKAKLKAQSITCLTSTINQKKSAAIRIIHMLITKHSSIWLPN